MHQIELSETQTIVLSGACAREDGLIFPVTANIKGGAVGNVLKSLLKRGLIEEISANDPDTVWRHDEDTGSITLRATPLAYSALGKTEEVPASEGDDIFPMAAMVQRRPSKQATLIEMLKAADGATIAQIVEAKRQVELLGRESLQFLGQQRLIPVTKFGQLVVGDPISPPLRLAQVVENDHRSLVQS